MFVLAEPWCLWLVLGVEPCRLSRLPPGHPFLSPLRTTFFGQTRGLAASRFLEGFGMSVKGAFLHLKKPLNFDDFGSG